MIDLLKELLWEAIRMWCHFPKPTCKTTKWRRSSRLGWAVWLCSNREVVSSGNCILLMDTIKDFLSKQLVLLIIDSWLQKCEGQKPSADGRHRRCTASKELMWTNEFGRRSTWWNWSKTGFLRAYGIQDIFLTRRQHMATSFQISKYSCFGIQSWQNIRHISSRQTLFCSAASSRRVNKPLPVDLGEYQRVQE